MNTPAFIIANLILSLIVVAAVYAIAWRALRFDRADAAANPVREEERRREIERLAA
jgi:hypothetical protein